MHFPDPVDAVVLDVKLCDLTADQLIRQCSGRYRAAFRCPIPAGRHESHLGCSHRAPDELDPKTILHHIDEGDHLDEGRPSPVAKNTLADRSISFAFSSSAICFFNRLISICAPDDVPGSRPASISARFFHSRNVSGFTPSRPATWLAAAKSDL